jgi:hypothetical protein
MAGSVRGNVTGYLVANKNPQLNNVCTILRKFIIHAL